MGYDGMNCDSTKFNLIFIFGVGIPGQKVERGNLVDS